MKLNILDTQKQEFIVQDVHPAKHFDNALPVAGDVIDISIGNSDTASVYVVKERRFYSRRPSINSVTLFVEKINEYDI